MFQNIVLIGEKQTTSIIAEKMCGIEGVRVVEGEYGKIISANLDEFDLIIDTSNDEKAVCLERMITLEGVSSKPIIAAYNTGISTTDIKQYLKNPNRFVGIHFFKLGQPTKLVEVVKFDDKSNEDLISEVCQFLEKANFKAIQVKERPGLLANRLMVPYLNQAAQAYDDGIATAVDIDVSVELGLGYPDGPLKRLDQIGIDSFIKISNDIHEQIPDLKYSVAPILKIMNQSKKVGIKKGRGFYEYEK